MDDRDHFPCEHSDGDLSRIFAEHQGCISDKWEHYLPIYQSALARFIARDEPVRLLEIGVQNGGSLQIWSKYLPRNSIILGIDINPACARLSLGPNVAVLVGDAGDPAALDRMLANARFDVIIDDGSHRSKDVIATFEACFGRLDPSGIYIVEDMHASYLASHSGGFRLPGTSMEWFKEILDALNADHFQSDAAEKIDTLALQRLRDLGRQIASVTFFDSVVLIERLAGEKRVPYRRIMTGRDGRVVDIAAEAMSALSNAQLRELLLAPHTAATFTPAALAGVASAREQVGELRALLARAEEARTEENKRAQEQAGKLRVALARAQAQATLLEASARRNEMARSQILHRMHAARRDLYEANLRAELAESEVDRLNAALTPLKDEAERVRAAEYTARQAIVDMYEASTSWRLTSPLRFATSVLSGKPRGRPPVEPISPLAATPISVQTETFAPAPGAPVEPLSPTPETQDQPLETPDQYSIWCEAHRLDTGAIALQRRMSASLKYKPTFSILVPLFRTPLDVFEAMVGSVHAQTHESWELCLALGDTGPDSAPLIDAARSAASSDARIHLRVLAENLGISGNSNSALEMATGEWAALLDHDDLLSPDALFQMVRVLNVHPNADFLYSDKDSIDRAGQRRLDPLFKPCWSPEIMLNANYLTHLCAIPTARLRAIGGWDPETDGAQDWDLFLRAIGAGRAVVHVPHVLYHWRRIETSVSVGGFDIKPYASTGQLKALSKYIAEAWPQAKPYFDGLLRVDWGGISLPKISLIVVGGKPSTHHLLPWGSSVVEILEADGPDLALAADNAIAKSEGDVLVLVDANYVPDMSDWVRELASPLANPAIAIVGGRVFDAEGCILDYGTFFQYGAAYSAFRGEPEHYSGPAGQVAWYRNSAAAAGGALAFRRSLWAALGGFRSYAQSGRPDLAFTLEAVRSGAGRLLLNPYARFTSRHGPCAFEQRATAPFSPEFIRAALPDGDPFVNSNLDAAVHKGAPVLRLPGASGPRPGTDFGAEANWVANSLDATSEEIQASKADCAATPRRVLECVIWIIPEFEVPFYGGIHTILRAADHMLGNYGVTAKFAVLGTQQPRVIASKIAQAFPELAAKSTVVSFRSVNDLPDLGSADAAVCTLWSTAYPLLRLRGVGHKFYFVQDWEPLFYPAGTASAAVETTYRFGFHGICNTPSLSEAYRALGGQADYFLPSVDPSIFHSEGRQPRQPNDPFLLISYARPGTPRNCFEVLSEGLRALKRRFGEHIEIVTVGAEWDPADYGLRGIARNLGLLPYTETGALYRAADAGLVAMATRHPSYLPFEWMACGVAVVSNRNPYTNWLLRDGENCLLCEMSRSDIAAVVSRLVENPMLRDALAARGASDIKAQHADWEATCERIYQIMSNGVTSN